MFRVVGDAPFGLSWIFSFGRYKSSTLEDIIEIDPQYVLWCLGGVEGFTITRAAEELLEDSQKNIAEATGIEEEEPADPWVEEDLDDVDPDGCANET